MFKDYLLQNWALILVLLAFAVSLKITVLLDKRTKFRVAILILAIFLLSIVVFVEFALSDYPEFKIWRLIMMSVRYSATPFIIALVMYAIIKKQRWFVFIPAIILAIIDIISIFTGIVFTIDAQNTFQRGPLGFMPFIVAGLYCVALLYLLIQRSNKRVVEIVPIIFLLIAFAGGLILPFVFGSNFSHLFCTTIGIALFAYFEFTTLALTKKDALTGLLNRQAYYSETRTDTDNITAVVSIDMNGLKAINDNEGHVAGDEALVTLSLCFKRALKPRQSGYRLGGDEFVIVCWRSSEEEVQELLQRIRENVAATKYTCSIGYCYRTDKAMTVTEMFKLSDTMMYADKERHYQQTGVDRRRK